MKIAMLVIGATLGLSGAVFAQSLADVAKKAEEQRAAAAAKADDEKKDAKKDDQKAPTEVYTNKDLKTSAPESVLEEPALAILQNGAAPTPLPIEAGSQNIVEMRAEAKRYFARSTVEMRGRIRNWAVLADTLATTCSKESYEGITRAMFQQHVTYCRSQLYDLKLRKASVDRFKGGMEEAARKKGIYPGVMREMFVDLGWTP